MARVKLTLKRSLINRSGAQRRTIQALGLSKINSTSERELNPQIEGMVRKVRHLIEVEEIK